MATSGGVLGISSATAAGARALTLVSVEPASGAVAALLGLDASLGWFFDSDTAVDPETGTYFAALASSETTSVIYAIDAGISSSTSSRSSSSSSSPPRILSNTSAPFLISNLAFHGGKLFAVAPCAKNANTDCVYTAVAAAMAANSSGNNSSNSSIKDLPPSSFEQWAALPSQWVAVTDGAALDERGAGRGGVLYIYAVNMYNISVSWATVFGFDVSSGALVSQARHAFGSAHARHGLQIPQPKVQSNFSQHRVRRLGLWDHGGTRSGAAGAASVSEKDVGGDPPPPALEIIFSLFFDPALHRVVALCSGVRYAVPWTGYYLAVLDLQGDNVVATPIGYTAIFGDGWPTGYSDAYPLVQGIGGPLRAFYCTFFLKPVDPAQDEAAWLVAINLDNGNVTSTAKSFPTNLVDLQGM